MAIQKIIYGKDNDKVKYKVYWNNPFTKVRQSKVFYTSEEAKKYNSMILHQLKYEAESFAQDESNQADQNKQEEETLETLFFSYLKFKQFKEKNLARTLYAMKAIIEKFGTTPASEITTKFLYEISNDIKSTGVSAATIKKKMGIIFATLTWAKKQELIEVDPKHPDLPQVINKSPDPLTPEEIKAIYEVAPPHIKRVVILGSQLGMRIGESELFKLQWHDVNFVQAKIRIPNAEKGINKPWRDVPLRPDLMTILSEWYKQDQQEGIEYIVSWKGNKVSSIRKAWGKCLKKAKIQTYRNPYVLRHTFATEAIKGGADYKTVAELMGHKNPRMIMDCYQHVLDEQKNRAVLALPPPPKCA